MREACRLFWVFCMIAHQSWKQCRNARSLPREFIAIDAYLFARWQLLFNDAIQSKTQFCAVVTSQLICDKPAIAVHLYL